MVSSTPSQKPSLRCAERRVSMKFAFVRRKNVGYATHNLTKTATVKNARACSDLTRRNNPRKASVRSKPIARIEIANAPMINPSSHLSHRRRFSAVSQRLGVSLCSVITREAGSEPSEKSIGKRPGKSLNRQLSGVGSPTRFHNLFRFSTDSQWLGPAQ